MPRGDRTGPMGMGPATGRGFGPCWYGCGRFGRGRDRLMNEWLWRQYDALSKDERREMIQEEIEDLQKELEKLQEELRGL